MNKDPALFMSKYNFHCYSSVEWNGLINGDRLRSVLISSNINCQIGKKNGGKPDPPPTIVSMDELRSLRQDTIAGKKTEATFVSRQDLDRIKKSTLIQTTSDVRANQKMQ